MKRKTSRYYIAQTAENKEFYIKNRITALFPEVSITIPIEKLRTKINGIEFYYLNRITPDYIVLECEEMTDRLFEKINEIDGVVSIMFEKNQKGKKVASEVASEELGKLLNEIDKSQIIVNGEDSNVILGQYAGYTGKIIKEYEDDVLISINTKKKLKVRIPIWNLGRQT